MNQASCAILRCCCIATLLIAGVTGAKATPTCVTDTLAHYIALDVTGGCTVGDFLFLRFASPTTTVTGNPTVADASQILLTPILNSGGIGFGISADTTGTNLFSIPNPTQVDSVTYHIDFTLDPPGIGGPQLRLDPPFGDVTVTQKYCLFDVFAGGCDLGIQAQQTVTTENPVSEITFPIPASFIDVKTDITLNASPGDPAGFDAITSEFVEAVPEPANILLSGFGFCMLSGVMYATRKLRSRKA